MTTTTAVTLEVPDLTGVAGVSDEVLIDWMRQWAEARRVIETGLARLAAQVGVRSLELGHNGLAQRAGARTPDALVSQITGASGPDARTMVSVGTLLESPAPWLSGVASSVASGEVSIGVAAAIQQGLGTPNADVAADDLADAARKLIDEAAHQPPEKAARRARELRDELDENGVADREAALREKRFLRLTPQADGMTRVNGLLDPESAALACDAFDLITAPRRGGPRFVDPAAKARADSIITDTRTTEQITLDAFVELIRIAAAADTGKVYGTHKPGVRVHVSSTDFERGTGVATIEGQSSAVSIATARRRACTDGILPILFDGAKPLDLGRSQRLYTSGQRAVLAAVWGGCAVAGCDRPPSWTEAHHADEWDRDHGGTDIENGVLLCAHHHRMVHNAGWKIRREGGRYYFDPPPGDPLNSTVELVPKNPVTRRRVAGS